MGKERKRSWTVERILEESRQVWKTNKQLHPHYLATHHSELYGAIDSPHSALCEIEGLKYSNARQRWLWVIRQLGLKARMGKEKIGKIRRAGYRKWIIEEISA